VAIGGNSLIGGKFSITGSIIGAYTIEMLNRTLLRLEIEPAMIKVFKAVFIIILMVVASPVVRVSIRKALDRVQTWRLTIRQLKGSAPKDSMISTTYIAKKKGE
jgi:simple sugar transport system permease protein